MDFLKLDMGRDSIFIGTLIPEENLWTFQADLPLQIFLIVLIVSTGFLIFRLIREYRNATSTERLQGQLMREIASGETLHLEFKSSLRWDIREGKMNKALEDVIVKSIAAFNNSDGGTLLIGVDDDGNFLGLEKIMLF